MYHEQASHGELATRFMFAFNTRSSSLIFYMVMMLKTFCIHSDEAVISGKGQARLIMLELPQLCNNKRGFEKLKTDPIIVVIIF